MRARLEKLFTVGASVWGILRILTMRPQVIFFGNDMIGGFAYEPRMAGVHEWLEKRNIHYGHLVHVTPHGSVLRHWRQRKHPVVYLEALELFGLLPWFLRASGARHLWSIDDFRHWPRVIATAPRFMRTVLFQHGRFTRHQKYLAFPGMDVEKLHLPDMYIVWNNFWRDRLLALSPPFALHPDRVRAGGRASFGAKILKQVQVSMEPFNIIVVHEAVAPKHELERYLQAFLSVSDCFVWYKVRKDRPINSQTEKISEAIRSCDHFSFTADLPDSASLIVGSFSTLLYEAVEQEIPVGVLCMASTQADDLVEGGLAQEITIDKEPIGVQLRRAASISRADLLDRSRELKVVASLSDTLDKLIHEKNPQS